MADGESERANPHDDRMPEDWRDDIPDETLDFLDEIEGEADHTMPPNPNNVEDTIDLSEDWRDEERATIDFYTNSACAIGRYREDAAEGVWLDQQEKRALYEALEDYFDG